MFLNSLKNLKSVKVLVMLAMLTAMTIVLDLPFLSVRIGDVLKINFLFVPITLCGLLFGPVPCALMCAAADVLGVVFSGQGVIPLLTLVELLRGLAVGYIMYGRRPTFARVAANQAVCSVVFNMLLNTAVLILVGLITFASVPMRLLKNAVALPIEILIMFALLRALLPALEKSRLIPPVSGNKK